MIDHQVPSAPIGGSARDHREFFTPLSWGTHSGRPRRTGRPGRMLMHPACFGRASESASDGAWGPGHDLADVSEFCLRILCRDQHLHSRSACCERYVAGHRHPPSGWARSPTMSGVDRQPVGQRCAADQPVLCGRKREQGPPEAAGGKSRIDATRTGTRLVPAISARSASQVRDMLETGRRRAVPGE